MNDSHRQGGLWYGLGAYGLWGLIPLYFKAVAHVGAVEVLAQRIIWSCVFLGIVALGLRRWGAWAMALRRRDVRRTLSVTTLLIASNWFIYIYAVVTNQVLAASLGYFIAPLANVLLGVVYLRERLRPWQIVAVGLASAGVLNMIVVQQRAPWIALALAATFSVYGLLRKTVAIDGLLGLWTETLLLLPASLVAVAYLSVTGGSMFLSDAPTAWLLAAGGLVTSGPLLLFAVAARRLPMTLLGLLQFISPTVQFALAVTFFGEQTTPTELASFALIWLGLAAYTADSFLARSGCPVPVPASPQAEAIEQT